MFELLLSMALMAPFPLPAPDGKSLAVKEGQKTFRLPSRFERVKAFYEERFRDDRDVTMRTEGQPGARQLKLVSRKKGDTWVRATVSEREMETVVDLVPVIQLDEEKIAGNGKPLVEFVIGRSPEVKKAVDSTGDPLLR
jgi:hypothetical protein